MANNLTSKPLRKFLALYEPKPMKEPTVPSDFDEINVLERIGVVLSYIPMRILWHISPDGGLQAWWKLLTRLVLTFVPYINNSCYCNKFIDENNGKHNVDLYICSNSRSNNRFYFFNCITINYFIS